jgi:hypothetical protein
MTTNNINYQIQISKQQLLYIQKCIQFSVVQSEDLDNEIDEYEEKMGNCLIDMIEMTTGQEFDDDDECLHSFVM